LLFIFFICSLLDAAAEDQRVNMRVEGLMRLAVEPNVDFWANKMRCHRIVQFQDRAAQTRVFIDLCRDTLGMVYKTIFPRNPQPEEFFEKAWFKNVQAVQDLVKAQMIVGAKFALIWVIIRHSKIDLDDVVKGVLSRCSKRRLNLDRHIEAVYGPAEQIDYKLLRMDYDFYRGAQHDDSTRQNVDRWM
jgi:hypothetical protein